MTDVMQQSHNAAALCSTDTKTCHDCILHAVATICMRRFGVAKETCHVMFGMLQQMENCIRTVCGDSTNSCGVSKIPLQGVLQGDGAGPAMWLVVSVPIITCSKQKGVVFVLKHQQLAHAFIMCATRLSMTWT